MTTPASAADRALVRATAEKDLTRDNLRDDYRQMLSGTLAALDWVEDRRATGPSTGERRTPVDLVDRGYGQWVTAMSVEIGRSGSIDEEPETPEEHRTARFHGAVWATLRWVEDRDALGGLAISVPELDAA